MRHPSNSALRQRADLEVPFRSIHQDHIEDTKRAIVAAARELFATQGYEATSIDDIVAAARVHRTAVYNYFDSKKELFRIALEQVEAEFIKAVVEDGVPGDDVSEELTNGCISFLDIATRPEVRRIVLTDGPVVLGWETRNEIEVRHGRGLVKDLLSQAMDNGCIALRPTDPLVFLLTGALNEAVMAIAHAQHPAAARRELGDALRCVIDSLRSANRISQERQPA